MVQGVLRGVRGWEYSSGRRGAVLFGALLVLPVTAVRCEGQGAPASPDTQRPPLSCEIRSFATPATPVPLGLDWRRSLDLLEDTGSSWIVRRGLGVDVPLTPECEAPTAQGSISPLPVSVRTRGNSTYPRAAHNGPLWEGRGLSALVGAGIGYRTGSLSVSAYPLLAWQENRPFEHRLVSSARRSPFANPWNTGIDLPQRFGDGSFGTVSPGQSFMRLDVAGVALGASTENLWWGPALRQPLILGSAAPGFPHLFLGTSDPADVRVGHVELEILWGFVQESEYFDTDRGRERGHFSGVVLGFSPRLLPGFHVGGAHAYHARIVDGFGIGDFLLDPFVDVSTNAEENRLVSIFIRMAPPRTGFEAYMEWGREDWYSTWHDLVQEPDHSRGYTAGFQQALRMGRRVGRLFGEVTNLGASRATVLSGRGRSTFYTHSRANWGHTHLGQPLGAPIGPGSDAQALGLDLLGQEWGGGILLERVRYENDAYYNTWAQLGGFAGHDVELTVALSALRRWQGMNVGALLGYSYRTNRNFLGLEDPSTRPRVDHNWSTGLEWRW